MPEFHDSEIYRGILESLPVGVCVVNVQKKIVLWSDGAEELTGHLRHEVIGRSCAGEDYLPCNRPGCETCSEECPLAQAIKTSQLVESIGYLHHKAGHEVPVRIRAVPVHNAHGSIIGAVETFEDQVTASPDHREDSLNLPWCIDDETGLASRIMMQSHLRETLGTFHEIQVPFGLLRLRLDGLDRFRVNFGGKAAALLLQAVGRTLEGALWKTDFVGRWSDDEFLVILIGCREDALHSVRERIRHMLASDAIEWWGERRSVPALIGQATAEPGDTIEAITERAQKSLAPGLAGRAFAAISGAAKSPGSF